jgi:hypothetical protein
MKVLHLTLKKKWFDMIASGEKKEEYREVKDYWINRLLWGSFMLDAPISGNVLVRKYEWHKPKDFTIIEFKNGYSKNAPTMQIESKGIEIREGNPEWGAEAGTEYFVIKLGEIIK